jgi:hypothetical protein
VDIAGWAVLAIGAVRLALRQRDVRQIDLVADLKLSAAGEGPEVGWLIRKSGASWPAYCLDEALALERPAPADRHLCVFFGADEVRGILCNQVWSLAADGDLVAEPLPGCMSGPRSPATGLARFEDGVALVTDAPALASYLVDLAETEHGRSR